MRPLVTLIGVASNKVKKIEYKRYTQPYIMPPQEEPEEENEDAKNTANIMEALSNTGDYGK